MSEKVQFDIAEEFAKMQGGRHKERVEKRERFSRLLMEQRVQTAFFLGEVIDLFEKGEISQEKLEELGNKYSEAAHWTAEQKIHIRNCLADVLAKHNFFKKLKEEYSNEEICGIYLGQSKVSAVKEVPGGIVFFVPDKEIFQAMTLQDSPFSLAEEQKIPYEFGQYLENYSSSHNSGAKPIYDGAIIIVNLADIERFVENNKDKFEGNVDAESLAQETVDHETFHLWREKYLKDRFFTAQKFYQDQPRSERSPKIKGIEQFDKVANSLKNEIVAHFIEGESIEKILLMINSVYLTHTEKGMLVSDKLDERQTAYKQRIGGFLENLSIYLEAAKEIIDLFGGAKKASLVLWSEEIERWPRLRDEIKKYGIN